MKKNLANKINELGGLRKELLQFIDELPSHPHGVKPLNEKGTAAAVPFSVIASNKGILSPEFYLGIEMKRCLKDRIKKAGVEHLPKLVDEIIRLKSYPVPYTSQRQPLPDDVVAELRRRWLGEAL